MLWWWVASSHSCSQMHTQCHLSRSVILLREAEAGCSWSMKSGPHQAASCDPAYRKQSVEHLLWSSGPAVSPYLQAFLARFNATMKPKGRETTSCSLKQVRWNVRSISTLFFFSSLIIFYRLGHERTAGDSCCWFKRLTQKQSSTGARMSLQFGPLYYTEQSSFHLKLKYCSFLSINLQKTSWICSFSETRIVDLLMFWWEKSLKWSLQWDYSKND